MPRPSSSIRFGPLAPVAGVLISVGILDWLGIDAGFYAVPLLAFALWCYGLIRQTDDGGLSPRNDRSTDSETVTPGQFVTPMSLVVVSMPVPESDPIDVVVWMPSLRNFTGRLSPEHVIGRLARSRNDGGTLEPTNFVEHEYFVQFLHQFLARELPRRTKLQEASRLKLEGWVSFVDERGLDAPAPTDGGPADEDVTGRFTVHGGLIEPGSYQGNASYRLLTDRGVFQLDYALRERLRQEIIALHAFREAGHVSNDRVM
jgi:hypothetical protein